MEIFKKAYIWTCWLPIGLIFIFRFIPVNWGHDGLILFFIIELAVFVIYFFFGLYLINHSIERNQSLKGLTCAFWISTSPIWVLVLYRLFKQMI